MNLDSAQRVVDRILRQQSSEGNNKRRIRDSHLERPFSFFARFSFQKRAHFYLSSFFLICIVAVCCLNTSSFDNVLLGL